MKKLVLSLALLMSISVAQASIGGWIDSCFDLGSSTSETTGCGFFLLSFTTFMPVLGPAVTTTAEVSPDDKAAYVQEVRDESAEFIAEGGAAPASAVLEDAILAVRALDPGTQGLTDLDVARALMN